MCGFCQSCETQASKGLDGLDVAKRRHTWLKKLDKGDKVSVFGISDRVFGHPGEVTQTKQRDVDIGYRGPFIEVHFSSKRPKDNTEKQLWFDDVTGISVDEDEGQYEIEEIRDLLSVDGALIMDWTPKAWYCVGFPIDTGKHVWASEATSEDWDKAHSNGPKEVEQYLSEFKDSEGDRRCEEYKARFAN